MPAFHARASFEAHNPLTGLLIVNVFHIEVDTLTSPPNWSSIASDIYAWLGVLWNAQLASEDTFDQVVVTDADYPGSTFGQGVVLVGTAGGRVPTDGKLNRALCGVVSWKTATAKRYARGHTFFAPTQSSTELTSTGQMSTSGPYMTAVQAFANAYQGGHTVSSTGYTPEIFSRTRVKQGATPFAFPILSHSLSQQQHWLRSRAAAP
jgi:hypothetical protein